MKISFIIPAYNEEQYLNKCLDSLEKEIAHSPCETEVIVVNNASTDKTANIAKSYPFVKLVHEQRKGIVWARKAGFLASTGDFIANIDADSVLPKGWLAIVTNEFSKDKKLVGLSGPFIYYDLSPVKKILVKFWYAMIFVGCFFMKVIFRSGAFLQGGNYIVRRDALEAIGGYKTTIDFYGEDADIAHRISKTGKIKFTLKLPMYSSARRLVGEGMATTASKYAINYFWILFFNKPLHKTSVDIRRNQAHNNTSSPL